jgi:hypothetical protein
MKYTHIVTLGLALALSLSVATELAAQSDMQHSMPAAAPSDAQKSFDTIKTFAGEWEGPVTVPEMPEMSDGKPIHVSLRVTSRGNAVVEEFQEANTPFDAAKFDHPVTMLYVDGGQLNLVHYCDAGNRPHMIGKMSPDGKTVDFALVDVSGSMERGHMQHAVFTYIDATHHTEDWTYMMPGDKPLHAHFNVHRVN